MGSTSDAMLAKTLRTLAHALSGGAEDCDPLIDWMNDARFALLGEASHGTHEFYRERARITERLIVERGFTVVAVEADWPDASRVNRYIRGLSNDVTAVDALGDFRRFPLWMWRNTDVVEFIEWLREHNDSLPSSASKTGFYGLDLYSLHASMEAVLRYLEKVDPLAASRVRDRYACFDHFGDDVRRYGMLTSAGVAEWYKDEVIGVLLDLQRRVATHVERDGHVARDEFFDAEQNARVVKNAEAYYRAMFLSDVSSWNLQGRHMAETLDALVAHLEQRDGRPAKAERKRVRPALADSYESTFHETHVARFLLRCRDGEAERALSDPKLERAIGVIYRPETERYSHYFHARLADQFDAVLNFDETEAVEALERTAEWEAGEVPETFPFGV
jgi:erythromycin esterase-like protein